jgi:hypothetical protein
MKEITKLKDLMEKNKHVITFDLKEAYNHVPVHYSMKILLEKC